MWQKEDLVVWLGPQSWFVSASYCSCVYDFFVSVYISFETIASGFGTETCCNPFFFMDTYETSCVDISLWIYDVVVTFIEAMTLGGNEFKAINLVVPLAEDSL